MIFAADLFLVVAFPDVEGITSAILVKCNNCYENASPIFQLNLKYNKCFYYALLTTWIWRQSISPNDVFLVSQGQNICTNCDKFIANERYKSPCYNSVGNYMSKEVLMLAIIIIGTMTITTLLSTSTISLVGQILPLPSITTVWALNVTGTQESDTLIGTNKSDNIRGHGEDDMISSLEGNDRIAGDMGDDTMHGDRGHDRIRAGEGDDLIFGDSGNDNLFGGPDDDSLTGGPGKDSFNCGEGTDTVIDFDPSKNETISTNCENMSSLPPPPPTIGDDIFINTPEPPAEEDVPEPPAEEDFVTNPFSIPLEEDDDGDGEEEEDGDGDGNGVE